MVVGHAAIGAYARGNSAVSAEAFAVRKAASVLVESAERSQVLFGPKSAALSRLRELATECDEADWDGAEGAAVDERAVMNAEDIVRALPIGVPLPEFAPEPDGAISLDWIQSRTRIFSVSVGAGPRLAYAWLDGSDRGHGVSRFDGERIPARVLDAIRGIVTYGNPSFRTLGSH